MNTNYDKIKSDLWISVNEMAPASVNINGYTRLRA